MRKKLHVIAPLAILGALAFIGLGGLVVMLLWNWVLPPLFGWPRLAFWPALGLLALCRILFGGGGLHRAIRHNVHRRMDERREHWTPEEKERFRQRLHERFGFGEPAGETKESP